MLRNAYKILDGKLGRLRRRWEGNIKWILKECGLRMWEGPSYGIL
jgi:hypothetical protein